MAGFLHENMEKLHYLVMDRTTEKPLAIVSVPLPKYDFVYRFDSDLYALRGLTEGEFNTHITLGTPRERDVSEFYTRG